MPTNQAQEAMPMSDRKDALVTNPDIAAYLAREPEPVFRRFPSGKGRYHHAGDRSTRAQDRNLNRR